MPTKKTSQKAATTPKRAVEVDPTLAGLDITEAVDWLNRRIARYDHANVDSFKIEPGDRGAWAAHDAPERTAPRARTFKTGHKSTAYLPTNLPEFPFDLQLSTGSDSSGRSKSYPHTRVTIADANELAILHAGYSVWAWLRRTDQEPGRRTNNGCRRNGIAWLEAYRDRVRPGMGRRAAIMATRAKIATRAAAKASA